MEGGVTQTEDKDLALVRQQFLDSEEDYAEYREEAELHRDYYDGYQWTDDEKKKLNDRGQPALTDNKIKDKIEYLLGVERKSRADPKAYPRTPSDEDDAEAATDALRYVADDNLFHYVRSDATENLFVEGLCGIETIVDKKIPKRSKVPKIRVRHVRWDRLYADARSLRCDYSDAAFKGIVTWMDVDDAKVKWPDKAELIDQSCEGTHLRTPGATGETFDDKPRWAINRSGRKRVQVLQHYYTKKGQWHECKFVYAGFLEDPKVSPYLDDEGEPQACLELQAMYKDRQGRPYGAIRRYIDLQDDWNKRRSKSLHLLNTNQVIVEEGMLDDEQVAKIRQEAAKPDGVIQTPSGVKLSIEKNLDLAQGHVLLMQQTGAALDVTGPNAALAGQTGDLSGKAKQIDQQGGLIAIDRPFDSVKYLSLRVYRHIWNRVQQFWTQETWIRIRDEEHIKFVTLNRRVTRGEVVAEELAKRRDWPDEDKQAVLAMIAQDPEFQKPVIERDVSQLDVDIILDEAPDVITLQQEQFGILVELAKARPEVPFKTLVELSSLSSANKRKVMGGDEEPDPMQQRMAELTTRNAELENLLQEAKVRREVAATSKDEAAAAESQVDAAVKVAQFAEGGAQPKTQVSVN